MIYTYDNLMLNGRLGNQLWQIAATINFARQNHGEALFNPAWEYRDFFSVPDEYFGEYYLPQCVDGGTEYFQEYSYFEPISDEIKSYFQPSVRALEEIEPIEGYTCSIHVRRGDYLNWPNHFPITTSHFYRSAVADIKADHPETHFVIFSDDIDWCKVHPEHFGFDDSPRTFFEGVVRPVEVRDRLGEPRDWVDLFTMMNCDRHIISNSTFAWWGAFLSDDPSPIYPSDWFRSAVPNWQNWENAMLPEWRKFEC